MAKATIVLELDEYLCSCLDYIRKMQETHDYSGLLPVIERLQVHGNNMEDGLRWYRDSFYRMDEILKNKKFPDEKKLKELAIIINEKLKKNPKY